MKNFKIIFLTIIGLFSMSCDLDEDPIFLDSEAVYTDINVAKGALDGIYQALTSYNAQERRIFAINGFSRTIDVHIRKLREKIGDSCFKTVKGVGYKFQY